MIQIQAIVFKIFGISKIQNVQSLRKLILVIKTLWLKGVLTLCKLIVPMTSFHPDGGH